MEDKHKQAEIALNELTHLLMMDLTEEEDKKVRSAYTTIYLVYSKLSIDKQKGGLEK